jgi:uncharacterized membrane protein YagU involved in acid resistance
MTPRKTILVGVAAGILASWLKALAEKPLQNEGLKLFPATSAELKLKGADLQGHPQNMPPAIMVKKIHEIFTDEKLNNQDAIKMMPYIHYSLGTLLALTYVHARKKDKKVALCGGFPAGAAMFALTHGSIVPALGLQAELKKMPKSWWVWEFGSHLLFGFFLEQSTKLFKKMF